MADQLYLSLWFPKFRFQALPGAVTRVLEQFSTEGVTAASVYPIDWNESPVWQRSYLAEVGGAATAKLAVEEATELLHEDYAYEFEARWELWAPEVGGGLDPVWVEVPRTVKVVGFGPEFDGGAFEQNGHVRVDFGLDTPFLFDDVEMELDRDASARVQLNVLKLVAFTNAVEKNCGVESRLLWSESGDSLAQKLIARLQKVN